MFIKSLTDVGFAWCFLAIYSFLIYHVIIIFFFYSHFTFISRSRLNNSKLQHDYLQWTD